MNAVPAVIAMAVLLAAQLWLAPRFSPVIAWLLRIQAAYWTMALVLRPLYLINARPSAGRPLWDPRLALNDYAAVGDVLSIAIVGHFAFTATLAWIAIRRHPQSRSDIGLEQQEGELRVVGTILAIGWLGRLATWTGPQALITALSPMAIVAACYIIYAIGEQVRVPRMALMLSFASELLWSVISASKTPIIAALVALVLRFVRLELDRELRRRLPFLIAAGIAAFLVVQPLKGIDTTAQAAAYAQDSSAPLVVGAVTSLLERFDAFSSVTDAAYFPSRPWLSPAELAERVALYALPKGPLIQLERTVGQSWTVEVRSASFRDQYPGVSLASAFPAEGYVLAGRLGASVEGVGVAALTLLAGLGMTAVSLVARLVASSVVFDTVLFESGLLPLVATVPKCLEIAAVCVLLQAFFRPTRRVD